MEATLSAPLESDGETDPKKDVASMAAALRVDPEDIEALGVRDGYRTAKSGRKEAGIAFTLWSLRDGSAHDEPLYRHAQSYYDNPYLSPPGEIFKKKILVYGEPDLDGEGPMLITEGGTSFVAAALALREVGWDTAAVHALCGANTNVAEVATILSMAGRGAYLAFDNDKSGRTAAKTFADNWRSDAQLGVLRWPEHEPDKADIWDLAKRNGLRWLGQALTSNDWWATDATGDMAEVLDECEQCGGPFKSTTNARRRNMGVCSAACEKDREAETATAKEASERQLRKQTTGARAHAIRRVRQPDHSNDTRIHLAGRSYHYEPHKGWLPISDPAIRKLLVEELAAHKLCPPEEISNHLAGNCLASWKDTAQPPAALLIENDESGAAWHLSACRKVPGVPWHDVMLHISLSDGRAYVTPRDHNIWCPRPPVPLTYGTGEHARPEATLAFLRRLVTPVDADPDAQLAHDTADWIMAGIGQTLCEGVAQHKVWVLTGAGGLGKGVLTRLIAELAGGCEVAQSPADLAGRFAMSGVAASRMLLLTDSPMERSSPDYNEGVARIKSISGGDLIRIEIKNVATIYKQTVTTTIWIVSNDVPEWATAGHEYRAWLRRFHIIDVCGPEPPRRIADLEHLLIKQDGAADIALYAVERYQDWISGRITEPEHLTALKEHTLLAGLDPLQRWASERLQRVSQPKMTINDLLADYRCWAERHDIDEPEQKLTAQTLGKALRKAFPAAQPVRKRLTPSAKQKVRVYPLTIRHQPDSGPAGPASIPSGIGTPEGVRKGRRGEKPDQSDQPDQTHPPDWDPEGLSAAAREMMNLPSGGRPADTAETPLPDHPTPADTIHGTDARLF